MSLKKNAIQSVLFLFIFHCSWMAYGFYVVMENNSTQTLQFSCHTDYRARQEAFAVEYDGKGIICRYGSGQYDSFIPLGIGPYAKTELTITDIDYQINKPFYTRVDMRLLNPSGSIHCDLTFLYYSARGQGTGDRGELSFFQMKNIKQRCTDNYLQPTKLYDRAVVHVY